MKKAFGLALILFVAACQSSPPPIEDAPPAQNDAATDSQASDSEDSAPSAEEYDGPIQSVVVDTDMSLDDLIAIAMLVESPATEVKAIAITGLFVRCPRGEEIMLNFLALIGQSGIPAACGSTEALEGGRTFPDDWRDFADAGWSTPEGIATEQPDSRGGVAVLAEAIAAGIDTLVVLGPPTTSAQMLRDNPELAGEISSIVLMAGALDAPGNLYLDGYDQPAWPGEWNVYVDPVATKELLSSGPPVVMVALDATNEAPVTRAAVDQMISDGSGPALDFAVMAMEQNRLVDAFDSYFWDALAAAYVLNPAVVTVEQTGIDVLMSPERETGRTVRDPAGPVIGVAVGADAELFMQVMIDALSGRAP